MMIKKQNYLKHVIVLFLLLLLMQPERAWAAYENVEFSSLTNHDGLTNSQVGAILKDTRGYIWFGTQSGLCRFDGFRMKTFYYSNTDDKSLPNNSVDELQQDYDGNIWVHTSVGYSIYKYDEEQFERKPEEWLKNIHVQGPPYKLLIDKDKNMWIAVYGQGLYYHNATTSIPFSANSLWQARKTISCSIRVVAPLPLITTISFSPAFTYSISYF